ncbi:MAG: selenocysteine-specific translation elongation factor [Lentisphaeria bacterium]|nr:selenocysteine-specific translation elongation factor [Candidatus Neomarinimicrobiota bacterium]MCF7841221.1 selenocysteine-specific translation elongation factor [Lentisphaeria bacterium]
MQRVVGLAGHIDHGKTAVVKALTGEDTDHLPEEKQRGVTIDMGIAFYRDDVAFIDVPGHEKFIKNMVTGVSTIDMAMLVIAADDGIMPQTREHLDILRLLGIQTILAVLNKCDLAEPEWVDLVADDIRQLLTDNGYPDAPIVRISAVKHEGIEELRSELETLLAQLPERSGSAVFRLPIDRVFSVKGFGTVVTGTVLSHELHSGQKVQVFPQGESYTVRGLQTHNRDVKRVRFGDRAALNLANASVEALGRGAFLATPKMFQTSASWLGKITVLPHWEKPVKTGQRLHLHLGTGKIICRIHLLENTICEPGESMLAQYFMEETVSAGFADKVVLRFFSPEHTLGGGELFWPLSNRLKRNDARLECVKNLPGETLQQQLQALLGFTRKPMAVNAIARMLTRTLPELERELKDDQQYFVWTGQVIFKSDFETTRDEIQRKLTQYASENPLGEGLLAGELAGKMDTLTPFVLENGVETGWLKHTHDRYKIAGDSAGLSKEQQIVRDKILAMYDAEPYNPPSIKDIQKSLSKTDNQVLQWLIKRGELVQLEGERFLPAGQIEEFITKLRSWFLTHTEISVADVRDMLDSSRKVIIPLLNYTDTKGLTRREGDVRVWVGEK